MKKIQNINEHWKLFGTAMGCDYTDAFIDMKRGKVEVYDVCLPCDVHMPLIQDGVIKDPVESTYSQESLWIEDKAWWFYRDFALSHEDLSNFMNIKLSLDKLDMDGQVYVNGKFIGQHRSAHYPFEKDIKYRLVPGNNRIAVRLTTGFETIEDERVDVIRDKVIPCGNRGDHRRAFSRKPQYCSGWDWMERIMTCGMNGDAYVIMEKEVSITHLIVSTNKLMTGRPAMAHLKVKVELDNHELVATRISNLRLSIIFDKEVMATVDQELILRGGYNCYETEITIDEAQLWWPNGYGDQPLYTITAEIDSDTYTTKFGIRTIELNQNPIDDENRMFSFKVNGIDIFAKGSNWVPSDAIYARVSHDKYKVLIEECALQNNNMLRIWGGGIYEPDIFYDLCDAYGILIWHDFMYACSVYPEYEKWFMEESKNEAEYQTKRLVNHPSMALWCGNNEMHWIYGEEAAFKLSEEEMKTTLHNIYNYMLPEIVEKNVPKGLYWNSSPYGREVASSENMGDNHIWPSWRHEHPVFEDYATYDQRETKFMSEYGYLGPCKLETIKQYCDTDKVIHYKDGDYKYHSHYFDKDYTQGMVAKGIAMQYGMDKALSMEAYLLLGGLAQGKLLEYSLEAFRSKCHCSGALLWMYNDAWGEEGWTTIDYYLNRKISYHYVRRAFSPVKLIMKVVGDELRVIGINETSEAVSFDCEIGFVTYDGQKNVEVKRYSLGKHTRHVIDVMSYVKRTKEGLYYGMPLNCPIVDPVILTDYYVKELPVLDSQLSYEVEGNKIKVSSTSFAHGVHFNLPAHIRLSDEYFDLLPGECREIFFEGVDAEQLDTLSIHSYGQ